MALAYDPSVSRQRQEGTWASLANQPASSRPVNKPIMMKEHNVSDVDIWGYTEACTCKCMYPIWKCTHTWTYSFMKIYQGWNG